MGYWLVLSYSSLRGHPALKIALAGVVPQRERRLRPIMDYTFNGVNPASLPLGPHHPMQFGTALQRLLQRLAYANPKFGPPLMAKIDLADGYYRVPLSAHAALTLAVILPDDLNSGPLLGIPLSLPMGWKESPPYFCAFTETCADLANKSPGNSKHPFAIPPTPPSAMQPFASKAIWPFNPHPPTTPLTYTDVYLDDFMMLAQVPAHHPTMNNVLFHLNSIFRDPVDSPRRIVVSQSKIDKGDATFNTKQRLLGWDVDSQSMHIKLPTHRVDRLRSLLHTYSTRRQLQRRPVPIAMVILHAPHYWAASDASGVGMGGIWMPSNITKDSQPCIWRYKLPDNMKRCLLTSLNPTGTITINDLELAAA